MGSPSGPRLSHCTITSHWSSSRWPRTATTRPVTFVRGPTASNSAVSTVTFAPIEIRPRYTSCCHEENNCAVLDAHDRFTCPYRVAGILVNASHGAGDRRQQNGTQKSDLQTKDVAVRWPLVRLRIPAKGVASSARHEFGKLFVHEADLGAFILRLTFEERGPVTVVGILDSFDLPGRAPASRYFLTRAFRLIELRSPRLPWWVPPNQASSPRQLPVVFQT